MLVLYSKLMRNVAAPAVFNDDSRQWLTFLGHPVYSAMAISNWTTV